MLENTYNEIELSKARQLAIKIKKEHFIMLVLWICGIVLTLFWMAFMIATSISTGENKILGETIKVIGVDQINNYFADPSWFITNLTTNVDTGDIIGTFRHIDAIVDLNPLCLTYSPTLIGWYICIMLAPIGYLGCIFIIAWLKNMTTPQSLKKANRNGVAMGYIKQKDADYIIAEIDYNIGLRKRPDEKKQREQEQE